MIDKSSLEWNYVFNSISDSLILLDTNGIITNCNAAFLKLVDKPGTQVIGSDCFKIIHGKTGRLENCPFLRSKRSKDKESLTINKDDKWFKVDVYPIIDENNVISGFIHLMSDITERKKAEETLRESEEKVRTMYDSSSDAIMLLDEKGFFDCNDATLQLFGCASREEFCSRHPADFSPPTQPDGTNSMSYARNKIAVALKEGNKRFEHLHRRLDGTDFPAEVLLDAMVLGGKKVLQARVYNITERKKTEEALQKSEKQFRLIAENTSDNISITTFDRKATYLYLSPSLKSVIGYDQEDLLGKSFFDFIHPEDKKVLFTLLKKYIKMQIKKFLPGKESTIGETIEYRFKNKEGKWRNFQSTVNIVGKQMIAVTRDITERKKAELALKESEKRFKYLFEQSPVSLWEEDFSEVYKYLNSLKKKGIKDFRDYFEKHLDEVKKCSQMVRILDINEITTKLFNAKNKKELITNLNSIFIEDSLPTFIEQLCTIAQNKIRFSGECINKTIDGKIINVSLKWNVVPGYEKDYSKVLISLIDVTEQKKAEEEIKISRERLKIMNKILRHDLANDFVVIGSALRLYKSNSETKMLNEIEKRVAKSLNTIKRLREQESFIDSYIALNEYDIIEVLDDIIADFPDVNINIKGSGAAFADEALYSVFENLINNAIKHGNSKKIEVSISTNEQFCEIRFKDFGTGIPDEIKDKVFDEGFVHGKKGNTGIGLYIVKQTIEGYGGNITIEDNKPKGAVFVINLRKVI